MPKINATSLGRKTIANFQNFVKLTEFFKIKQFFVENEIVWRNFHKFFDEILQKIRKTKHFDDLPKMCLFSKLCRNTIARSFLGKHWNCQSLGFNFHPSGLRPLGWKKNPRDWQFQCIPRNYQLSCNNTIQLKF